MRQQEKIGPMRHRIEIIQLTNATDTDFGGDNLTNSSIFATVWASWQPKEVGSGEQLQSDQKDSVQSVNFVIRYLSGVKPTMLIKYEGLFYDILSVLPDSHRAYTTIEARQRGEGYDQTVT